MIVSPIGSRGDSFMASIELKDVIVDFPIYNANTRSFKNTVLKATIGGKVDIYEQNLTYEL